jgi:sec-independent protein translocase protein TatA
MRLGIGEIVVVLALALLFFGPSKLPQLGSSLGQAIKSFKKGLNSLHEDVDTGSVSTEETKRLADEGEAHADSPAPANVAAGRARDPKSTS